MLKIILGRSRSYAALALICAAPLKPTQLQGRLFKTVRKPIAARSSARLVRQRELNAPQVRSMLSFDEIPVTPAATSPALPLLSLFSASYRAALLIVAVARSSASVVFRVETTCMSMVSSDLNTSAARKMDRRVGYPWPTTAPGQNIPSPCAVRYEPGWIPIEDYDLFLSGEVKISS